MMGCMPIGCCSAAWCDMECVMISGCSADNACRSEVCYICPRRGWVYRNSQMTGSIAATQVLVLCFFGVILQTSGAADYAEYASPDTPILKEVEYPLHPLHSTYSRAVFGCA